LARCVITQLLLLPNQRLYTLLQVMPASLILVERDDGPEVGIGEPFELLVQVRPTAAQRLAASQQRLRQPRPAMGPRNSHRKRLRLVQQSA
jgi:hypothetical protein